jgi:energy-converting hydrogenase Eha subunit C
VVCIAGRLGTRKELRRPIGKLCAFDHMRRGQAMLLGACTVVHPAAVGADAVVAKPVQVTGIPGLMGAYTSGLC